MFFWGGGVNEIGISLPVLRKDPKNFCARDRRNTMASWELKTEANISKMYKKLILKICCSFVATSVSILILKKNSLLQTFSEWLLPDHLAGSFWNSGTLSRHQPCLGTHPSLSRFDWEEADGVWVRFSRRTLTSSSNWEQLLSLRCFSVTTVNPTRLAGC